MKIKFGIPLDKLKHLIVGVLIAVVGIAFIGLSHLWHLHLLIPIAIYSAGFGRELYNYSKGQKFDWMDIFATAGVGMVLYVLFAIVMQLTGVI
jgi:hypothetical protein